jgi:hypothetical protein
MYRDGATTRALQAFPSNLIFIDADAMISDYIQRKIRYTRYADDLSFQEISMKRTLRHRKRNH